MEAAAKGLFQKSEGKLIKNLGARNSENMRGLSVIA